MHRTQQNAAGRSAGGLDRRDWAVGQGIERGQTQSGEGTSGNRSQQKRELGRGHVVVYNHGE